MAKVIKELSNQKSISAGGFTRSLLNLQSHQLVLMLHKLFKRTENERELPNPFYKVYVIFITKPDLKKTPRKRK